jgi:hypothetical protein
VKLSGRVIATTTDAPLYQVLVEAWDPDPAAADDAPRALAAARTNRGGAFRLEIEGAPRKRAARIALYVFDPEHSRVLAREPTIVGAGEDSTEIVIRANPPRDPGPPATTIKEQQKDLGIVIAPVLDRYLKAHHIETFDDLRSKGGLAGSPDLPLGADQQLVQALDAHAALTLLPASPRINAALIGAGFRDVLELTRGSDAAIAEALKEIPEASPSRIRAAATDQADALANFIVDLRTEAASGSRDELPHALQDALPQTCSCTECQSATGPIAYLADLLDYSIRHLRNNGQPITLTFLQDRFLQPFRDLPATCAALEGKVRRVRICVEVLRRHLGVRAPAPDPAILEAAYRALLEGIGTSFDEIRQISRHADPTRRAAVMARLMLTAPQSPTDLFRDPNAPAGDPLALTEGWLNQVFGLRDTTLQPLASAPDPQAPAPAGYPQLLSWQRRTLWERWHSADYDASAPTLDGRPFIDPDLIGLPDLKDVTPNPLPRAGRNRTQWSVLDVLEDRQDWTNLTLAEFRAAVAGPAAGLRGRVSTFLQQLQSPATSYPQVARTGMEGLTFAVIRDLYKKQSLDTNIAAELAQLAISAEELTALGQLLELIVAGDPILYAEWEDFYSVILGRLKRFGFHALWKYEEERLEVLIDGTALIGLTLSPHHFQMRSASALGSAIPWRETRWRSTQVERRRWEDILQARTDQMENLVTVLQNAVDAAEIIELPELRTSLLQAAAPAVVKGLTDHYQIDFADGACAITTRVAQAIQTLQGVLFGARNGLLDDPALSLADDGFDGIWQWLGTFAAWQAAMQVLLYPENLLRPTLRANPSPGFTQFIEDLRSAGKIAPASAREAVAGYEEYFVDICNLGDGVCATAPAPGISAGVAYQYLVARSSSGRLYWCYFDTADEQSYWRRLTLPGLEDAERPVQLFGAAHLTGTGGEHFLYVFAKVAGLDSDSLILARTNLRENADLSRLRWQVKALALPAGWTRFAFARVPAARNASEPIKLSVWLDERTAYVRALNREGLDWAAGNFAAVPATGAWRRLGHGTARNGADFACSTQQIPPRFILAGDFDRDGQDEIAIIPSRPNTEGNDIWLMKFDPAAQTWRHMSPIPDHPFDADLDSEAFDIVAKFAVAGDFDGDGYPEIAISADLSAAGGTDNMDDTCFWARKFDPASGTWARFGSPASPLPYGLAFGSKNDFWSLHVPRLTTRFAVVGDFDGDGRDEIAIATTPLQLYDPLPKIDSHYFIAFDLELHPGGAHIWRDMPELRGEAAAGGWNSSASTYSRFALAGRFRVGDDRDSLLISKKHVDGAFADVDPDLGNSFWGYRFDGQAWQEQEPALDCAAGVAVAVKFGVTGDFDGDGAAEVALAQEAKPPGAAGFAFWIRKMALDGSWSALPDLQYGDRVALFAMVGDFDSDGRDEIAIVAEDFWASGIAVFDLTNGKWQRLDATNPNLLGSGGALTTPLQPGQIPGDEFRVAGVAANVLPAADGRQLVVLAQPGTDNTARAYAFGTEITGSWEPLCGEPEVKPAFAIANPVFPKPDIELARQLNARVPAALGSLRRRANREYLNEMLFFLPLEIACRLRENGTFQEALDWCRLAYDYHAVPAQRIVAAKLLDDGAPSAASYDRWLQDTLNPHAIAETRPHTYLRYTILLICRCLIDWADAEFSKADAESVPRARELYKRALDLLNSQEIRPHTNECAELIDWLAKSIGQGEWVYEYESVFRALNELNNSTVVTSLVERIRALDRGGGSLTEKVAQAGTAVAEARAEATRLTQSRTFDELRRDDLEQLKALGRTLIADESRARMLKELGQSSSHANLVRIRNQRFVPAPVLPLCIPPNPALTTLRQHAELCLRKIHECKNIAGLELCLSPYGTAEGNLADIGFDRLPAANEGQPLPYRYATLIERTKQFVEVARQTESSMLQFIGSAEQARYEELKARQDLELTQAGVQLTDLQVIEAQDSATAALLQRDRAQLQMNHYTTLIGNGLSTNEQLQIANLVVADLHQHATAISAWIEAFLSPTGSIAGAISSSGAAWAQNSQFHGLMASLERRAQEWQFSRDVAREDVRAAQQQIVITQDQLAIAGQQRSIEILRADHAATVVDFIAGKFLNADLYEWMADVMQQVYRFFLQQATQLAKLAELQLAFERQEPPPAFIKSDYWERPASGMTPDVGASLTGTNSVAGLTGSARLLRDVYELDQYAFTKNQRKQQLSETLSLAQFDPLAFQIFRQTGNLPFATPMELFDRRFPGHYLRLIKRVRTSVVALIPPTMGIRATLSSVGTTRVTTGPDIFRTVTIQRGPQQVALSSPVNATGLFDLDAQPELLVPFEGLGVDGHWVFDMPKAANPFDYDAVADVLVTIDYTALQSDDYQEQLLKSLDRRFDADRAFSFRREFADAWYDLNNPEILDDPDLPMTVSFRTRRTDFPPNLEQLTIRQVLVQFVQPAQSRAAVTVDELYFASAGSPAIPALPAERTATSDASGLISTRSGAWRAVIGASMDADLTWTLKLPQASKARFKAQEITDIFLLISYGARSL